MPEAQLVLVDRLKLLEKSAEEIRRRHSQAMQDIADYDERRNALIEATNSWLKEPIGDYTKATGAVPGEDEIPIPKKSEKDARQLSFQVLPKMADLIRARSGNQAISFALNGDQTVEDYLKNVHEGMIQNGCNPEYVSQRAALGELINNTNYIGVKRKFSKMGLIAGMAGAAALGLAAATIAAFGIDPESFTHINEYRDMISALFVGAPAGAGVIGGVLGSYFMTPEMGWIAGEAKYIDAKIAQCKDAGLL